MRSTALSLGSSSSRTLGLRIRRRSSYPTRAYARHVSGRDHSTNKNPPICNLRKNLALGGIFFSNLFVYTITRDTKDVMFVLDCGAEYIPFVKTWINLPVSFLVVGLYQKMLKRMDFHQCYRILYMAMMVLSGVVGIGLYPARELLALQSEHALLANWVVTLYYVLSPVYGSLIISVLFWSLANMYTNMSEAKRIYPLMGFVANIALIVAGITSQASCAYWGATNWNANIVTLCTSNLLVSGISIALHRYIETSFEPTSVPSSPKANTEVQPHNSFATLLREPFVVNMIVMTASYGLMVSLFENVWKHNIKLHFSQAIHYTELMATISFWKGVCTMIFMCMSSFFLKRMSWLQMAMITPLCLFGIGAVFFATASSCTTYSGFVVMTGAVMVVFLKSLKYAFTDPCKEIAFIPTNDLIKTQGKATVDLVSSPIGKSGGSFIQQVMFMRYPIQTCIPAIGALYMSVCLFWIRSIFKMNHILSQSPSQTSPVREDSLSDSDDPPRP